MTKNLLTTGKTSTSSQPNSRLEKAFNLMRKKNRKAFVPFTVLGDPNLSTSFEIIKTYIAQGADMLELGLPFSDPVADGPVIQLADQRALKQQSSLQDFFQLLKKVRQITNIPISILTYANLPFSFGIEKFYRHLQLAGVDAVLIADVPLEEAESYVKAAHKHNVHQVFLLHENMNSTRFSIIKKMASGYFYLVSQSTTTGAKDEIPVALRRTINFFKKHTELPILVGFGISNEKQITTICNWGADGVIIGSKLVRIIEENLNSKVKMLSEIEKKLLYFKHAFRYQ